MFWAGISARMTPGCPRDISLQNFLFGLIFVLENRGRIVQYMATKIHI